ncbi:MAG: hypothetical protein R3194_14745, partial [Limnobacter sp.]|nr:hypothetical protein [Limnobacter sp.]
GPAGSALLDAKEKAHCLRTLLEHGTMYINAELPDRAKVLVGFKDFPCLLTQAVYQGESGAVELLIKHGADVHGSQLNRLEGKYNSPLAVAVRTNQPEVFARLIQAGADPSDSMYLTQDVLGQGESAYRVKIDPAHIDPISNPSKIDSDSIQTPENSYHEFPSVKYFINHVMVDPSQRAAFQAHLPDSKVQAL